ncbi:MAG: DPP IV N-terminal domain-containing protein [Chloroflexota bacterium]
MKAFRPTILSMSLTACGLCVALLLLTLGIGRMLPANRLIFLSDRDGPINLFGMDIARGLIHKLNDVEIAWTYVLSPDGQQILYSETVDNQPGVFLMDFSGKNSRQLIDQPAINPAWSPDSQTVTFASFSPNAAPAQIYRVQSDGADLKPLTQSTSDEQPFSAIWSPDGTQILFQVRTARDEVRSYFMNADGSAVRPLTFSMKFDGIAYPQWSPDGQRVAFVGTTVNTENQAVTGLLCIVTVEAARSTCSSNYISGQLSWSPDSKRIVFVAFQGYNIYDLEIFDMDSGETRRILRYDENAGVNNVSYPIWTGDGRHLIYQVSRTGKHDHGTQLHIVNVDGSGDRSLTGGSFTNIFPTWWAGN